MSNLAELHAELYNILLKVYRDADGEPDLRAAHPYLYAVESNLSLCVYAFNKHDEQLLRLHAQNVITAIDEINAAPSAYLPSMQSGKYACPFKESEWYTQGKRNGQALLAEVRVIAQEFVTTPEVQPVQFSSKLKT